MPVSKHTKQGKIPAKVWKKKSNRKKEYNRDKNKQPN